MPSLRSPDLTLNLEWAGQHIADTAQPSKSQCSSITLMLPLGSQAGVTQLSDLTSYIKLIRTDTTLDLSQKAEKGITLLIRLQQPVIPPLLGVGGGRCSVKPASRCALHSKSQETYAFTEVPTDLTLNLEWAGQHIADTAQPSKSQCCSITLMLPLGSQAGVTQLSDLTSLQSKDNASKPQWQATAIGPLP
ncbi:hypothetical protein VNO80_25759 [Phaseolus coccineus]|uniref:Uncharacterized protein n=1 Tax=Phaseolus coccineus TaxID=3886 RepID=A0AAN9M032_PHACN